MSLASTVIADGAVGFWKHNDSVGSTTAIDQIGNSNGTYGSTFTLGVGGLPGGNGETGVQSAVATCSVPDVAAQRVVDTFTLEVWVQRVASSIGVLTPLIGGNASGSPGLRLTTDNLIEFFKQSVGTVCKSTEALTDTSSWHHIVATKAGSTSHLYIDGVDVTGSVTNQTMTTTSGHGWLLLRDFVTSFTSSGLTFAYSAIYPTALNSTKVASHYTLGITGTPPTNTAAPAISGTTVVGKQLTATGGTWTDVYGNGTLAYQWQRDNLGGGTWSNVSGATLPSYTVKRGDAESKIRCAVTMTNSGGSASATSSATGTARLPQTVGVPI